MLSLRLRNGYGGWARALNDGVSIVRVGMGMGTRPGGGENRRGVGGRDNGAGGAPGMGPGIRPGSVH